MKVQRQSLDVSPSKPAVSGESHTDFGAVLNAHSRAQRGPVSEQRQRNNPHSFERTPSSSSAPDSRPSDNTTSATERSTTDGFSENTNSTTENNTEVATYYGYGAVNYVYQVDTALDLTEGLFDNLAIVDIDALAELGADETPGVTAEALIAETLDISEADAAALLDQLGTSAQDQPTQLAEPAYQRQVVQAYYQVAEPAQLLSIEAAPETLAKLGEAVATNYIVAGPETQVVTESTAPDMALVTDDDEAPELLEDREADPNLAGQTTTSNTSVPQVATQAPQVPVSNFEQALDQSILNQVKGQLKLTELGAGSTEIRIALTPESLGEVQARIITQNGVITAQFMAESERVREIIETNMAQLREELEEQGIQVGELSVSVQQDNTDPQQAFEQGQQKNATRINDIINNIAAEFDNPNETILEDGTTLSVRI